MSKSENSSEDNKMMTEKTGAISVRSQGMSAKVTLEQKLPKHGNTNYKSDSKESIPDVLKKKKSRKLFPKRRYKQGRKC